MPTKANPEDTNFDSPAADEVPRFVGELFGRTVGVELRRAPYRGTQPAIGKIVMLPDVAPGWSAGRPARRPETADGSSPSHAATGRG